MTAPDQAPEYPLVLRLLDHQIVAPDKAELGKVDDIELELRNGNLVATSLLIGPGALGPRLPGRLGTWTTDMWRRLTLQRNPQPTRVAMLDVQQIGSDIQLTAQAARMVQQRLGLEQWLLTHLIGRIPGAHAGADENHTSPARHATNVEEREPDGPLVRLSELLAFTVHTDQGMAGTIHEVIGQASGHTRVIGDLTLTAYVFGPKPAGSMLGYSHLRDQGPLLVGAAVRWLHRHDRTAPTGAVDEIDLTRRQVRIRAGAELRHPLNS